MTHRVDPAVDRAAQLIRHLDTHKTDEPQVAEPIERAVARMIDGVIWFGIAMACSAVGYYLQVWFLNNPGVRIGTTGLGENAQEVDPAVAAVSFAVALALVFVVEVLPTSRTGQTWAKRRLHLRVVGPDGGVPGFRRSALRFVTWFAPLTAALAWWGATFGDATGLAAMVALATALAIPGWLFRTDSHRGLHDLVAGTRVLSDR